MALGVGFVHEIMEKDEHRVTANTPTICKSQQIQEVVSQIAHSPNDRMRRGVPFVVSLRRSPEGSILKTVHQTSRLWLHEGGGFSSNTDSGSLRFIS